MSVYIWKPNESCLCSTSLNLFEGFTPPSKGQTVYMYIFYYTILNYIRLYHILFFLVLYLIIYTLLFIYTSRNPIKFLLNFILPLNYQDIQAQTLLLSMGASWGDHPGHLVVPSSVTDVELYLFGKYVAVGIPTKKCSKGMGSLGFGWGFLRSFHHPHTHTKKMSENFGVGKSMRKFLP